MKGISVRILIAEDDPISRERIYMILLTAKGGKDDIVAGLEAGADDYVTKPFDRAELRARVDVGIRMVELHGAGRSM